MLMTTRTDFLGYEFDWFAIDRAGCLALCSSAGYGEIPAIVIERSATASPPIEHINALIAALTERGRHRCEGRGPGSCSEWRLLGSRGLYVYDWDFWSGPYQRIIAPEVAIQASDLDPNLLDALAPVVLPGLHFAQHKSFHGSDVGVPME